ncbi:MAG TPA: EutN/CcmL family microcompartment protein [Pyrinomonadaceae bacterium]|nr:EutN/CcmL family microcompartment protein [Pyrinomonadaceae bacterium]
MRVGIHDADDGAVGRRVIAPEGEARLLAATPEDQLAHARADGVERYAVARVMLCQPLTPTGEEWGATLLALDSVDSGVGDTVLIVQEGWGASTAATGEPGAAIDSAIVGVVDRVDLLEEEKGTRAASPDGRQQR